MRTPVLDPKIRAHSLIPRPGRAPRIESVRVQAREVAGTYNLGHLFQSRDGDSVILCHAQCGKNVFRAADDTTNQRRLKL